MTAPSSDTLLRRWQGDGDRQALEQLLRIELPRLRDRLARNDQSLVGASVGATDAAQEAAHRLLDREEDLKFEGVGPLRSFLWTTARHYLIDRFRRRRRREELEEPDKLLDKDSGVSLPSDIDPQRELFVALRSLSFPDREIIEMVYMREHTIESAAKELSIAKDAARMRLARAQDRLREIIALRARAAK
jgi:RNA polymerase sigma factor (sigma-70 family)